MSLLSEYDQRTAWKYEPLHGHFPTPESLNNKIEPDGHYAPFRGSTVVFRPNERALYLTDLMQKLLYRKLAETGMLAEPLPASTVHMTLHDLVSPEKCNADPADKEQYDREVADSVRRAAAIVERIRRDYAGRKISLTADRIVNMVSKSLVLMLRPCTEEDYALLLELYGQFDEIVSLPYPLTPHITLAYFRPGMLDGDVLNSALEPFQPPQDHPIVLEFDVESLTAQMFGDMRSYMDVPERLCFCCDGGLNRSVMAASILNHMARERDLPVTASARAAFRNTHGQPVPQEVRDTLEKHGIPLDDSCAFARGLEHRESPHFSDFAAITAAATNCVSRLEMSKRYISNTSAIFYGIPDPQYGEVTYEQAFEDIQERVTRYLDAFSVRTRKLP